MSEEIQHTNSEKEILVKVEGVSKKFCKDLKRSLWYGLQDLNPFGKSESNELRKDEFWAVKDVSFELRRGECLGLIGHNGAGKSTLLKMLNGLINPDQGKITMYGKVGALIELGAGFNPILTGRENIYNNGAVLGFTKEEIDSKVEAIIDFAEIHEFIDMPVQYYSSGMKVRLGFAVAAQMEPDVLIIDEVLAVGDLGFVLKCFKMIDKILPNTALIFVSHSMPMISRISTYLLMLNQGVSHYQDNNVSKGIDVYYSKYLVDNESKVVFTDDKVKLTTAWIEEYPILENVYQIPWGKSIIIGLSFENLSLLKTPFISLAIYDKEQRAVAEILPQNQSYSTINEKSIFSLKFQLNNLYLSKGTYSITVNASENDEINFYFKIHKALTLRILHDRQIWTPFYLDAVMLNSELI